MRWQSLSYKERFPSDPIHCFVFLRRSDIILRQSQTTGRRHNEILHERQSDESRLDSEIFFHELLRKYVQCIGAVCRCRPIIQPTNSKGEYSE